MHNLRKICAYKKPRPTKSLGIFSAGYYAFREGTRQKQGISRMRIIISASSNNMAKKKETKKREMSSRFFRLDYGEHAIDAIGSLSLQLSVFLSTCKDPC